MAQCFVSVGTFHHIFPQRKRQQVWPSGQSLLWDRLLVEELPEGHGGCDGNFSKIIEKQKSLLRNT